MRKTGPTIIPPATVPAMRILVVFFSIYESRNDKIKINIYLSDSYKMIASSIDLNFCFEFWGLESE